MINYVVFLPAGALVKVFKSKVKKISKRRYAPEVKLLYVRKGSVFLLFGMPKELAGVVGVI